MLLWMALPTISPAQTQSLFFTPPSHLSCPGQTAGDFNLDGKLDLACADGTILLGNGDGTFRGGRNLGVSGGLFIAAGDFNGDGKPDLLLAGIFAGGSANVDVFLGNGNGTFQSPVRSSLQINNYFTFAIADFDGDGILDLVGTEFESQFAPSVPIEFHGKGDGSFSTKGSVGFGSSVIQMFAADFNGDGKLDLLELSCSNFLNPFCEVDMVLNGGNLIVQPLSVTTDFLTIGDFNHDGRLDIMVGDGGVGQGNVNSVYLGNGDGSFTFASSFTSPDPASSALTGDFNGDGNSDVVLTYGQIGSIYLNNGDGTFAISDSVFGAATLIADFNNDGEPDIATPNSILLAQGNGKFEGNPVSMLPTATIVAGIIGDFNNDGIPDMAVTDPTSVYILLGDGQGKFSVAQTGVTGNGLNGLATADLNGDGNLDLVILDGSNTLELVLGNGDGSFGSPMIVSQNMHYYLFQIGVADFNSDHKPDLALLHSGQLTIFLGNGDGTFGAPIIYPAGSGPTSMAVADFNNDGKLDIAADGSTNLAMLVGNGDGTFQPATLSPSVSGIYGVADLDHDGNLDLVTHGGAEVRMGKGDGTFQAAKQTGGFAGNVVAVADVNGDGAPDLINSLQRYPMEVLLNKGDGTFAAPIHIVTLDPQQYSPTPFLFAADLNRDGHPDLAVALLNSVVTFLNITQPGPAILASPLSPATIATGGSSTSTVTIRPTDGFNSTVTLSCSSILLNGAVATTAPPTCSFNPSSIPNSSGTSTLTVSTMASSAMLLTPAKHRSGAVYAMWLPIVGLLLIGTGLSPRVHLRKDMSVLLGCLMLSGLAFLAACGGGNGSGGGGGGGGSAGTPAGTYTITVKAAAGSTVRTTNLTLKVQ
jgi:hypothetical protein